MENIIYKYSDFFQDDGGFDKIRSDFDKLGDDLVKKAKDIRSNIKIFDLDDIDAVKTYEAEAESLMKMFKKYGDAKEEVNKIEKAYHEQKKKELQTSEDQLDNLTSLDKKLKEYQGALAEVNTLQKNNIKTDRDLNRERVEAEVNIKKVKSEMQKQQREIIKSTELSREEQKMLQAKITLEKTEMRTLSDVRERISALRTVVQSLDMQEEAGKITAYNAEINQLTETLSDNSDKFIQSKINIGNYEESIVNALKGTKFFTGELDILNGVLDKVIDVMWKSTEATEANTAVTEANTVATEASAVATVNLKKSFNALGNVVKASGILLLLTAVASLASVFAQGRAGAIATEKVMARFAVGVKVTVNLLASVGNGLIDIFSGIGTTFSNIGDNIKLFALEAKLSFMELTSFMSDSKDDIKATKAEIEALNNTIKGKKDNENYSKGWDKISKAVGGFGKSYDDAMKAIKTSDAGAIQAFKIGDKIKRAELDMIGLRREVSLLEIASGDSTRSLTTQAQKTDLLMVKKIQLLKEEANIEKMNLQLANAKARVDAESAGFSLAKDEVKFAEELLSLNQKLDPTKNPLDPEMLNQSVEALKKYKEKMIEIDIAQAETAKQRREIQRDLFEQNLDLLIDLIDTEKNLSEQYVNDVTKNFQSRVNEFNRFLVVFRGNAQKELDEFTKESIAMGNKLKFDITFKENGDFDLLINGAKLAKEDIVEMNKQLQATGMNEIEINRFREFVVETRNGVKDFRDLNKELRLAGIAVSELRSNLGITQDELKSYDDLQAKISLLKDESGKSVSVKDREKLAKKIEKLEQERTHIEEMGAIFRNQNRIKAINEELLMVEEGSQRYYELLQERLDIEKDLEQQGLDRSLEKTKEANQKKIDEYKKFAEEVRQLIDTVLTKVVEANQRSVDSANKKVEDQGKAIDKQQKQAEAGLKNTLAFEQRELGKREAELAKKQKQQERLEKIKALYSSYNNYASQGDQNPIMKALRDFAMLEAITASFGDGGIVEDKLPSDGIFRGQSHRGSRGGIPILVEGKEGIFSTQEMANLGRENFYKMKDIASMGKVDSNFFSRQRKSFMNSTAVFSSTDPALISEMRDVKRAIESKPVQNWNVAKVADGVMELVEETMHKNGVKRNHYIIKKPKL